MAKYRSTLFYPLDWPHSYARRKEVRRSQFSQTFSSARQQLEYELNELDASNIIISMNMEVTPSGSLKATSRQPSDPAVAVYFVVNGEEKVMACDKWDAVEDNLRAIGLTLEKMRAIDRYGVSEILNRMFHGLNLDALPESISNSKDWWTVLGVKATASKDEIAKAVRRKKLECHPDRNGGDETKWREFQEALNAMPQ
jgi:hypothetical protein